MSPKKQKELNKLRNQLDNLDNSFIKLVINFYVIFLLICFQGFVGWYMVSSGLVDRVDVSHYRLSIHLLIAFIILTLILWNYLKINIKQSNTDKIKYNFLLVYYLCTYLNKYNNY